MLKKYETQLAGRNLSIETGKIAELANGSVVVRYGETVVMVNVTAAKEPKEGVDFFPLSVDYEEKLYAVGKIPGGFTKREGKPTDKAILTSRAIDRPLRPLFPKDFRNDTCVVATVLSVDPDNSPEVCAMIGASAALSISDIPFGGPTAAVAVGYVDNQIVINPTLEQREKSRLTLTVAGTLEKITMIEAGADEIPNDTMLEAIKTAHEEIKKIYIEYAKRFDACAEIDQDKAVSCSQILTYKTFKYNNILSVVIISSIQATSKWVLDYNIYNIDLTSGKEIKYSDMVSTLGYDNDTLLDKEKELLKNKMNELWGTDFDLNTSCFAEDKNCYNTANKMLETSINDGSILYFVNDNGNLNILVVPYADFVQDGNINRYLIEVTK